MKKYTFEVSVEENSEQLATEKLKAAVVIMQKLSTSQITKLAEVVKNDPVKTAMGLKMIGC